MERLGVVLSCSAIVAAGVAASCAGSPSTRAANPGEHAAARGPVGNPGVSSGSCRGNDLDADRIAEACAHQRPDEDAPASDRLRVELEPPAGGIVSGETATVVVRYRNVSAAALEFQLSAMCVESYDARILGADGNRVDLENEVGGLGICSTTSGIRVVLEPGGVLTKRLEVSGRAKRWVAVEPNREDSPFELAPGSPIRPGKYTLDVALPLYTDRGGRHARVHVETPLAIVDR